MIKQIFDRLLFALIGFLIGAGIGALLYLLYDLGFSGYRQLGDFLPVQHASLATWVNVAGGAFAAIGFLYRDKVGDALGESAAQIYRFEAWWYRPVRLLAELAIVAAIAVAAWYL